MKPKLVENAQKQHSRIKLNLFRKVILVVVIITGCKVLRFLPLT